MVGNVALFNSWRDLEPQFGDEPEMGWIFATRSHGKGIASEACRAALDWADSKLQPVPIWAIISPENHPSIRLAEKLGFIDQGLSRYHDEDIIVLQRAALA